MRIADILQAWAASVIYPPSYAFSFDTPTSLQLSASQIAQALTSLYPNPSVALLAPPNWWWQSGSALDGLLTHAHITGDTTYNALLTNTLLSQATGTNDFMTADATGNDDQAWWALAAMTAAESGLAVPAGTPSWLSLAQNVFNEQKARWDTSRCNGGMKWKIAVGDGTDGWHYKSSIANGLFFQLAARIAKLTNDADALAWAEKSYDWVVSVGLIDGQFNVYDGTDDAKGTGCVDVDHDMWSYNVGVFMYGAAVMASHTSDPKWSDRTAGFLGSVQRNFVRGGALFEMNCEGDGSCNSDQVSFKGALARWMGTTAALLPSTKDTVEVMMTASTRQVAQGWSVSLGVMQQFTALEVVDALMEASETVTTQGFIGRRSVAGRISW